MDPEEPAWTVNLLSDSRAVVIDLLEEPAIDIETLRPEVENYRGLIQEAGPIADQEVGELLVQGALALLDAMVGAPPAHQRLAQVALRYFVLDDDGDDDLASPFGLDDDVEVFNAVVDELGLPSLRIGGPPGVTKSTPL